MVVNTGIVKKIEQVLKSNPDILYGFADISYSPFSKEYKTALVIAVPHEEMLDLSSYKETKFEQILQNVRKVSGDILNNVEEVLQAENIKYLIPPMSQQNEEELLAVFSFKHAAIMAGLGWIGKNDALITEKYGPRVRLSVVLVDYPFETGTPVTENRCGLCRKCVDICPNKTLKDTAWNIHTTREEVIDYHLCNQKRSEYIKKYGRKNACGLCMIVCPYGIGNVDAK